MPPWTPDSPEMPSPQDWRAFVATLARQVRELQADVALLRAENQDVGDQLTTKSLENDALRAQNQQLRDEIARLKNLPPRPPLRPSGMEKATRQPEGNDAGGARRGRGPKNDWKRRVRDVIVKAEVPAGSRFKGYETSLVREIVLASEVLRYRRERWITPDGKSVVAPLPKGVIAGFGASLRQFCLIMHAQGQVTTERLTSILNGVGVEISKRQVVRLLTSDIGVFCEEDQSVLRSGLLSAPFITVDDTSARHAHRDGVTTHIGGDRFTVFRTGVAKSRLNFLSLLRGVHEDYVINDAALAYMREHGLDRQAIAKLVVHPNKTFASQMAWLEHLAALKIDIFDRDLVRTASEAALWGSIRSHNLLDGAVVVSDDAGQFRIGVHALCWVHAERLVHKLMPATRRQEQSVKAIRDQIWRFYRALKTWKAEPSPHLKRSFETTFDRIFSQTTGYEALDNLLQRLRCRKAELLRVLERPKIPLHTNASENDIRACVTKRKISGGTMSIRGRQSRDVFLGLMKTCMKLDISFFDYVGDRLGLKTGGQIIPPLAQLVAAQR